MKRPWQIWLAYATALMVAVAAVGWLSYRALESERAERLAQSRASLEENARLALWRLDSAVSTLVAQENARSASAYRPFAVAAPASAGKAKGKPSGPALIPSPLLAGGNPQVKLYFEFGSALGPTSPSVPEGNLLAQAVPRFVSAAEVQRHTRLLDELCQRVDREQLLALLPSAATLVAAAAPADPLASQPQPQNARSPFPAGPAPYAANASPNQATNQAPSQPPLAADNYQQGYQQAINAPADLGQQAAVQQARGASEFQARSQYVNSNAMVPQQRAELLPEAEAPAPVMTPLWVADQLLLARSVSLVGQPRVQGCWLDWPAIREQLLATVRDLLPGADLVQADPANAEEQPHRMAALPVKLLPGELPAVPLTGLTPVRLSLLVTWGSLALAALAFAVLLAGVLALSERRAAFVSAVTHELRTPLTTFRMYAEMLVEGMVPDEATRRRYLETLRDEADRLTHLVENVLAYARLERGGPGQRIGPVAASELLAQATERLAARAAQADFAFAVEASPGVLETRALADPAAVEQILFNLVDNACKYARTASDRRLTLSVATAANHLELRLRDFGPGVPDRERKRLFQPFRKSARDAADSAPGVGLGLALCQRLARDMRGELALENHAPQGASFVLRLPLAAA